MDSQPKQQSLRRQAPWVVACRVVGILATLAGNILAARLLGPAEFGRYLFLFSIAVCGGLIGAAGLSDAVLRFSSESLALGRRRMAVAYVRRAARLCILSTLLAGTLTAGGLFTFHLVTGRLADLLLLIALTVLTLTALTWQLLSSETLRGWDNLKLASLFSGGSAGGPVSNLLFFAGIAALTAADVSVTAAGVMGLLAASVCLTVPFALWCVWRMIHRVPVDSAEPAAALSPVENRQLLSMAGTVLALNLLAFVSEQFDIWIGEALLPPAQLGMYGVAKRSMLLTAMPVQMVMLTIIATIPRLHAQGRRLELQNLMRGSAAIAAVPSLTALALLVAFPESILSFLFGGSYGGAAPMIRILSIGYLLLIVVGNPVNVLALTGRHRTALSVNVMAAIIVAVGGPLATAWFGAAGLAWTTASALTFQYALQWWLVRRQTGVWTHIGIPRWRPLPADEPPAESPDPTAVLETTQPLEAAGCSCSGVIKTDLLAVSTSQSENEQRLAQP